MLRAVGLLADAAGGGPSGRRAGGTRRAVGDNWAGCTRWVVGRAGRAQAAGRRAAGWARADTAGQSVPLGRRLGASAFLGMEVEQDNGEIRLHLDTYIQEMLTEYQACIKKDSKLKKVPMQPGVLLTNDDCPEIPDPREQTMC